MTLFIGIYLYFWGEIMKNSRGNILVSLLFILIIISVLSIGAYQLVYSATKNADFNEDRLQAYYIAKSAADIVIENIHDIKNKVEENNDKTYEIEMGFPIKHAEAIVKVERIENNQLKLQSTGWINKRESKSSIVAFITFDSIGDYIVYGIDENRKFYKFNEDVNNGVIVDFIDEEEKNMSFYNPRAIAWDRENTLILVSDEPREKNYLLLDIHSEKWVEKGKKGDNNGIKLKYVTYSGDTFYAIDNKNGKVYKLTDDGWYEFKHKPKEKPDKIACGNNTFIGISKNSIYYLNEDSNKEKWDTINVDIDGNFNSIIYDNGIFVIVGKHKDKPLFLYSYNGREWSHIQNNTFENDELLDAMWTGERFISVGNSGKIYSFTPKGDSWDLNVNNEYEGISYSLMSSHEGYLVIVSNHSNNALISKDGGDNWIERKLDKKLNLIDIIVISKGDGNDARKGFSIKWSE